MLTKASSSLKSADLRFNLEKCTLLVKLSQVTFPEMFYGLKSGRVIMGKLK